MNRRTTTRFLRRLACCLLAASALTPSTASANQSQTKGMTVSLPPKFALPESGLRLSRRTQPNSFYDIVGRRSAAYGYEHRGMEAWVHPLKIVDDLRLAFKIGGYPLEFAGADTLTAIDVRPEATTFTYTHAAFTVRAHVFAPIDEPGIVMLIDADSTLPMTIHVGFRPRLSPAWPGGLQTGNLDWEESEKVYYLSEDSQRHFGVIGSPLARDVSAQPYQEEPRDTPTRFTIEATPAQLSQNFIPIIITGASTAATGATIAGTNARRPPAPTSAARENAKRIYDRLLNSAQPLYEKTVAHYRALEADTLQIKTPDARLDEAFAWAKVGVDKGVTTNPHLGTGLVAGFRASGQSERPGFAWFFGRDALWTTFALNSYGDFPNTRRALNFLKQFQRDDGKIPHEISQAAGVIPWFTDYGYAFSSADATPLYCIAHADLFAATGDTNFLRANWDSIRKAYEHTARTDTDGNDLVENTNVGHGWVEGGDLYPVHEEIYMQGVWVEASRRVAELAGRMNDGSLASRARAAAERTRQAMEKTYWLEERGHYAFATKLAATKPAEAEAGANRERRQLRLNELASRTLFDEDTVLPAVPLWWKTLDAARAQNQIDRLGSARLSTDWGARILSDESKLYDPLSYHHGSVWGLFTGWASLAAYNHGRPHVGYQSLTANALLTYPHALGYVTELLSGDFNTPFGRSSHHQIWSEAMVATPAVRGLLGLETHDGGRELRFAPQLPAKWDRLDLKNVPAGGAHYDVALRRATGEMRVTLTPRAHAADTNRANAVTLNKIVVAPALPLDARVRGASLGGRPVRCEIIPEGDVQRVAVSIDSIELRTAAALEIVFTYDEGTDVFIDPEPLAVGARSTSLRVIRSRAGHASLRLVLEGLGARTYSLGVRTPARLGAADGVVITGAGAPDARLRVTFGGEPTSYTRREVTIPLAR